MNLARRRLFGRGDGEPPQPEAARTGESRLSRQQVFQQERRQRRLKRYEEVMQRYRQGDSLKSISKTSCSPRRIPAIVRTASSTSPRKNADTGPARSA